MFANLQNKINLKKLNENRVDVDPSLVYQEPFNVINSTIDYFMQDKDVINNVVFKEEVIEYENQENVIHLTDMVVNEQKFIYNNDITLNHLIEEMDGDSFEKERESDGHTPESIASLHNVSIQHILDQIEKGIKIEREHTSDEAEARLIAMDHLVELPDYYTRLDKMEEEGKKDLEEDVDIMQFINTDDEVINEAKSERKRNQLIAAKDPNNYMLSKSKKVDIASYGKLLFGLSGGILMSLILPFGYFRIPASYSKLDEKKFNELKSLASNDAEAKKLTNQLKTEFQKDPLNKDKIKYLFNAFKKRMRVLKKKSIREGLSNLSDSEKAIHESYVKYHKVKGILPTLLEEVNDEQKLELDRYRMVHNDLEDSEEYDVKDLFDADIIDIARNEHLEHIQTMNWLENKLRDYSKEMNSDLKDKFLFTIENNLKKLDVNNTEELKNKIKDVNGTIKLLKERQGLVEGDRSE